MASLVGELEVAKTVADIMKDDHNDPSWKTRAADAVNAIGAPCAPYSKYIIEFVEKFTGGVDAPLVDFMDAVSKQFQCTATVGETFWKAVVEATFQTKDSKMPLVRVALVLANLASPKIEDGISRLIVKTDVTKLQAKLNLNDVLDADKKLKQATDIARSVAKTKKTHADAENGPLGRFFVRVVLHLVDKGRLGLEQTDYESVNEICALYLAELSELVGGTVTYKHWTLGDVAVRDEKLEPPRKKVCTAPASLEQQQDKEYRALEEGYQVDTVIFEKAIGGSAEHLWKIKQINASFAKLVRVCDYRNENEVVSVDLDVIFKEWAISKLSGDALPVQMMGDNAHEHHSLAMQYDLLKAHVFQALVGMNNEIGCEKGALRFYRKPDHVRANQDFAAGELCLTPFGPLSTLSLREVSTGVLLGKHSTDGFSSDVWMVAPPKPSHDADDDKLSDCALCPFFWVDTTTDSKIANMKEGWHTVGGVRLPYMKNAKAIKLHDKLFKLKEAKEVAKPLSNIMIRSSDAVEPKAKAAVTKKCSAKKKA